MLKALLHRKLRWAPAEGEIGEDDEAWDAASGLEDPLTSTIFERLAYLDPDLAWDLLRAACASLHGPALPEARPAGAPVWSFWPRLAPGIPGARGHVEPDVLVQWGDHVLIVEVKHRGGQRAAQWVAEVQAARAAPAHQGKTLWLVAAGGLTPATAAAERETYQGALGDAAPALLHLDWDRLCEVIHERRRAPLPPGASAVLLDILAGLSLWGYRRRLGFDSLPRYAQLAPIRTDAAALSDWRIQ